MTRTDFGRIVAIVPVRSLSGAKSRLGEPLDAEERADLVLALLRRTVAEALAAARLAGELFARALRPLVVGSLFLVGWWGAERGAAA